MEYIETYADVKKAKPKNARAYLRDVALTLLSTYDNITGIEEILKKPRVQFLILHHIFKDEEAKFAILLEKLALIHTFISYSEAIQRVLSGNIDKPYITFSFDDGFKNHLKAAEILYNFGAKSCFFINPSVIGETDISKIYTHNTSQLHFPPVQQLTWKDTEIMQKMGHEFGSHTMYHKDVTTQSKAEFEDDLNETRRILLQNCGEAAHFAYPYGRYFHFNKIAFNTVFTCGFTSCASAERGCHISHFEPLQKDELLVRRDDIVLDWHINHIFYFLTQSARKATFHNNILPASYK